MKHVHPDKLIKCYNVCRVGGSIIFNTIDTSIPQTSHPFFSKEREHFINDFKAHGFDILAPEDFYFEDRVGEFNEVSMRSARVSEMSCFDEYSFEKLCVCGDWMFTTDYSCVTESKDLPKRGGKRVGAGAKSKHNLEGGTAVIRVPRYGKESIKDFIDFIIETNLQEERSLSFAIYEGMSAIKLRIARYEERGLQELAEDDKKNLDLLEKLYDKLPRGFVSKTSDEEKRGSVL